MKITIDIPKEFEKHFDNDRFKDSMERIKADLNGEFVFTGLYERELLEMLIEAFENAEYAEKHSRFIPFNEVDAMFLVKKGMPLFNGTCSDCGAMCFDDDTYCSECGSILDGE